MQGLSNRQIAAALHISYDTARRYSSRVRQRFGVTNVAALACATLAISPEAMRTIPTISAVLSASEIQVAALACHGLSTKLIARQLGVSPRTVDKHRQHILRKTGTPSIRGLTAWVAAQYALCGIVG